MGYVSITMLRVDVHRGCGVIKTRLSCGGLTTVTYLLLPTAATVSAALYTWTAPSDDPTRRT